MKIPIAENSFVGRMGDDERVNLSFLLAEVTRLLRAAFDQEMERLDLTRSQWHALIYVLRLKAASQTQLAEALEVARPSVGTLIDQLEKSGYVTREADTQDRRIWRVVPTEFALARSEEIARLAESVANNAFGGLSQEQIEAASSVIQVIRQNLAS
ncbi:MarR family transcriptional regulator [Henriciella sp.]|uniref:MarR family winged helix-turn-helix transcriptional regulator n=1 Tax=Henriciella sp. TaxID=1968823 RepID=UPI002626514A|nr:MarR family transcriptional regulator [Henriciella sp.]